MRSHASWSNRCRGASCSCAARSARTILLAAKVVVIGVATPGLYLSLARPSRKLVGVRPTARAHPRGRGDQPGAFRGRGRRGPPAVPRHHGDDPRDDARRTGRGRRGRGADVRRQHAPQSDVLAVRRGPDHRGAVRRAGGARRTVSQPQDGGAGRARPRRDRVAHVDAHLVLRVRLHHDGRDRAHDRARQGARPAAVGRMLLRELRLRLRRQGRDVRPGGGGAARPAASHRGAFPARAACHGRDVSALHPFSLLAIAAALPAFAWILPAPTGGLATAGLALMLPLVPDPRWGVRVVRLALLTAAPFWLFLRLLHDGPTTVAIGGRITTMVASFVWLVAVLSPDRLVEAMVARGWSLAVAYVFAATLSAVPVLKARARRIVEAQRCRGLSPRGSVANRLRALRALALPLVLSALHEVDERTLALETRGLGAGVPRTPLAAPPDRPAERVARWALLLLCLAALIWRLA